MYSVAMNDVSSMLSTGMRIMVVMAIDDEDCRSIESERLPIRHSNAVMLLTNLYRPLHRRDFLAICVI